MVRANSTVVPSIEGQIHEMLVGLVHISKSVLATYGGFCGSGSHIIQCDWQPLSEFRTTFESVIFSFNFFFFSFFPFFNLFVLGITHIVLQWPWFRVSKGQTWGWLVGSLTGACSDFHMWCFLLFIEAYYLNSCIPNFWLKPAQLFSYDPQKCVYHCPIDDCGKMKVW